MHLDISEVTQLLHAVEVEAAFSQRTNCLVKALPHFALSET